MKTLIIEDEIRAGQQLESMLRQNFPETHILASIQSVEESVEWLKSNSSPDLIFMDIQLADGLSFEIFQHVDIESPIIFTTAYDQYSIRAFKVNSIDYLLKPIQEKDLQVAVKKFKKLFSNQPTANLNASKIDLLLKNLSKEKSRKRFVVKEGNSMVFVSIEEVSYFYSEDGISFLSTTKNKRYILDMTLDKIEQEISEKDFFRINRGQIISVQAIQKIHPYFNHRLKLEVLGNSKLEFIVSRNRTSEFKEWMNQ